MAAGLAAGLAIGKTAGLAEEKAEEQRSIAIKMKEQGIPASIISQCTELSIEEIALI